MSAGARDGIKRRRKYAAGLHNLAHSVQGRTVAFAVTSARAGVAHETLWKKVPRAGPPYGPVFSNSLCFFRLTAPRKKC
jgi:hypothetical protein